MAITPDRPGAVRRSGRRGDAQPLGLIRQRADAGVVIEVGDAVAVCTPDALHVRRRPDPDWIIRSVGAAAAVVLDDPQGRAEEIRTP